MENVVLGSTKVSEKGDIECQDRLQDQIVEVANLESNSSISVILNDEKSIDTNSENVDSKEQNVVNSNNTSDSEENSDSKLDYALKTDDNDTLSDIEDIKTDSASADSEDSALGSFPSDSANNERDEEVQDRSDGSDSGLGSETVEDSKEPNFDIDLPCASGLNEVPNIILEQNMSNDSNNVNETSYQNEEQCRKLLRSSLKRKYEDPDPEETQNKRKKKNLKFDGITVYYFPRSQGFVCVPSQGGSTLGMEWEHTHVQKFTLAEHAIEQKRLHRQLLQQIKNERNSVQGVSLSSSEDSDTEEETSDVSDSELDLDNYYFLQPVPTRQRRALLRAAGVRKIEGYEKDECRDIRTSRELCGCACKGVCNPETCSCSIAGIKCQVDRLNFPCGCSRDSCGNTTGRVEFNPIRVRTHFIHTLMRLGFEKKNEESQEAARRQWSDSHLANNSQCNSNSLYQSERCLSHEDGLLRDVSLSPRVEVETCVNAGSFNNVHCDMNNTIQSSSVQENLNYGYQSESTSHINIRETNILHFNENSNQNNHMNPYTSNMLQGKGPPYSANDNTGYQVIANNLPNFQCDVNYTYDQHTENHHLKGIQSFSASSFEEFAHNSQMSMFSHHYSQMYMSTYFQKQNAHGQHSSTQYQSALHNHYDLYKNASECVNSEIKSDAQHYTTLTTMPYQSNSKTQSVDGDENWFSHNTLLNLDHTDQTQDASDVQSQAAQTTAESGTSETTENFGELIKKTMVESVIV